MREHTPDAHPARLRERRCEPFFLDDGRGDAAVWVRGALGVLLLLAGIALVWMVLAAPERPPVLEPLVGDRMDDTGVTHPVTAVLLGFRAYDTLLEVVVLTAAMVAVWSMDRGTRTLAPEPGERLDDPVLRSLARLVVPLVGLATVYLGWVGSQAPGGAFSAGALLAGAGALLVAAGLLRPPTAAARLVRGMVAAGLYTFMGAGLVGIPSTGSFLGLPAAWAGDVIVVIEAVLTLSIAVALLELFVDVPAVPEPETALDALHPTGDPLGRVLDTEGASLERMPE